MILPDDSFFPLQQLLGNLMKSKWISLIQHESFAARKVRKRKESWKLNWISHSINYLGKLKSTNRQIARICGVQLLKVSSTNTLSHCVKESWGKESSYTGIPRNFFTSTKRGGNQFLDIVERKPSLILWSGRKLINKFQLFFELFQFARSEVKGS